MRTGGSRDEVSRPRTPLAGSPAPAGSQVACGSNTPIAVPVTRGKANKFEEMLAQVEIDVDLDF